MADIRELGLVCLKDVERKEVSWLIPQRIPRGCITLLAGDGGVGKTTIWCGIAAAVSSGTGAFFEQLPEDFKKREPGKVLFFSSEDSIAITLLGQIESAGGNKDNIFSVPMENEKFSRLKFDNPELENIIEAVRPELVIFDPLQSFLPPDVQMGSRNQMRNCLNKLAEMGEKYGTSFLIVCHTNKRDGAFGRNRIADSADVWDIARSVFIAGVTKDGENYLSHEKNSYAPPEQTALFSIDRNRVARLFTFTGKTDRDFVREANIYVKGAPAREEAEQIILDCLRDGEKDSGKLEKEVVAKGISKSTFDRAKYELKKRKQVKTYSKGFGADKKHFTALSEQAVS